MNANKTVPVYEIKTSIKIDEITNIGASTNTYKWNEYECK